ncbi:senescence-associated protein-domain-containing protein [Exophiala viscosa]|uniref:Senescence-associated protein-domain-containing protein n=1 Tax=Exophiala viscosa TaxID=2486360 RepID=A0AAN6DM57_9EURO|nr:senescence-associated protein-domain-containing protein [Exophiala viscosa]
MSAGHSEPHVLYSVNNISAFAVQDGEEHQITTSGPQTLSLLMVPTSSPFADLSSTEPSSAAPEEDFYLHLHLPPELDLPLPATTQIFHKPPSSYLIPRWDLGPDAGAFIRIQFPSVGTGLGKVTQEEVDTFETILAQCTAFLERAHGASQGVERYNPQDYRPGEGYISSTAPGKEHPPQHGQIVLIDEENGSVIGELGNTYDLVEASSVTPGSKRPVQIQLPAEGQGNQIRVDNVSEEFLAITRHPAYAKSTIVQSSATASRLIVTSSNYLAEKMSSGANAFQQKSQPNPKPMTFSPATHARIRQIHSFTQGAVGVSAKTVGQLGKYAQNFGARMAGTGEKGKKEAGKDYKPGLLNKSMIAFSTIADGIDQAGRNLLASSSVAATNVVGHKYGPEAGTVVQGLAGGVKNVGLVYIDAMGVSRRAVIKSVAKGMVVGKMPNGQQLIVGSGDGGVIPAEAYPPDSKQNDHHSSNVYGGASQAGVSTPGYGVENYGNTANAPPAYSGVGEPLGSTLQGQNVREKR